MKIIKIVFQIIALILIIIGLVAIVFLILGFRLSIPTGEDPHWDSLNFAVGLVGTIMLPILIFLIQIRISQHHKKIEKTHKDHINLLEEISSKLSSHNVDYIHKDNKPKSSD